MNLHKGRNKMDFIKMYKEEDFFPREITQYEEREYGLLFFDDMNKDSYDSNHAVIFKDKIHNLGQVLFDIIAFYKEKGVKPIIYQSINDDGYFEANKSVLLDYGFECWSEMQKYMVLSEKNAINPNRDVIVQKVTEWKDEYEQEIFEKASEPWEIDVVRKALRNSNTLFFVAFYNGRPVGMTHCHITDEICRVDYLLVSKECRNIGVARAIINCFVEYCKVNKINNCYLWPDGETAEKIYFDAGFRIVEIKQAGRATFK